MIGVLGGMGPLATVDFFAKVVAASKAISDEGHVPLLIHSDPRLPSRPAAILHHGESPLPALMAARDRLIVAGAVALAMPCNTAHYWYDALVADCPVPFLSIVTASVEQVRKRARPGDRVAILGTRATLESRLFERPLRDAGFSLLLPDEHVLATQILPSILQVKQGKVKEAGAMLDRVVKDLLDRGASQVVLACTEIPLALAAVQSPHAALCIDTNDALARACVAWWEEWASPAA